MKLFIENLDKNYEFQILDFLEKYKNDTNFKLQTSGSTGQKKEIYVLKKQLQQSAIATIEALNLKKSDTALLCLHFDFIASKMMLIRAFEADMNLVISKPNADLGALIEKYQISFAAFVPLQIEKIIDSNGIEMLNKIQTILIGGTAISQNLACKLQFCSSNIYQTFGMTETVSHIALRKINEKKPKKYYTILPHIEIKTNAENCLCIKGDVTNNVWIETTDVIHLIDNQNFEWIGRKDFVINSGGIKIHPEELETKIAEVVKLNFVISSLEDEKLGQKIVLVLEQKNKIIDEEKLLLQIKNFLSVYEAPKLIVYLLNLPFLENGKINRLEIKNLIAQQYL